MSAQILPLEVAVNCAEQLMEIAAAATRDGMTLARQASVLLSSERHGQAKGILKKYVGEYGQYAADEVKQIIAEMEAHLDPQSIRQAARVQAKSKAYTLERARDARERNEKAWLPGGKSWEYAIENAMRDSKTLSFTAGLMRDGTANKHLVNAVRAFYESEGDMWGIELNLPDDQRRAVRPLSDASSAFGLDYLVAGTTQGQPKKSPQPFRVIEGGLVE